MEERIRNELEELVKIVPLNDKSGCWYLEKFAGDWEKQWLERGISLTDARNISCTAQSLLDRLEFYLSFSLARLQFNEKWQGEVDTNKITMIQNRWESLEKIYPSAGELVWQAAKEILLKEGISSDGLKREIDTRLDCVMEKVVNQEFEEYSSEQGFRGKYRHGYENWHIKAAQEIRKGYEVGVAIAEGGLYVSYLLSLAGLPVMTVEMKRKGKGATWVEQKNFEGRKLEGKKILLLENDIITGKTLRRAVKEIKRYHPQEIGICFMEGIIHCRRSCIPAEIIQRFHLMEMYHQEFFPEITQKLAQRFDEKYKIFRKRA